MKGYDNYREVNKVEGMDWMPKIPAHWEQKKIKFLADIKLGKMLTPDNPGGYFQKLYLRAQNVAWMTTNLADVKEMWFSAKELDSLRLRVDDLVISEGGEVGRTAIWKGELDECYIQNSVHKLTCKEDAYPRYMLYLFSLYGHVGYFDSIVNRISLAHLTGEKLKEVTAIVPPLSEQLSIAQFLDDKTAQIDQLITQKQQMLELLREERAALINHAVTKGLDAAAPLRDSGIEWLGEVPAHWEVKRLKFISPSISVGLVINPSTYYDDNGTVPMISGKHVTEGGIDIGDVKFITEASNNSLLPSKLNAGDLVSIRVGYPGVTAVIPKELDGINCASVMIIRKGPSFHSPFLAMLMNSPVGAQQVDIVAYGSAQKQFNVGHAIEFIFPLPPLDEQVFIVEQLATQTDKIAETAKTITSEITLLREYRAALIAEAVTGQIDVRHYEPVALEVLM